MSVAKQRRLVELRAKVPEVDALEEAPEDIAPKPPSSLPSQETVPAARETPFPLISTSPSILVATPGFPRWCCRWMVPIAPVTPKTVR